MWVNIEDIIDLWDGVGGCHQEGVLKTQQLLRIGGVRLSQRYKEAKNMNIHSVLKVVTTSQCSANSVTKYLDYNTTPIGSKLLRGPYLYDTIITDLTLTTIPVVAIDSFELENTPDVGPVLLAEEQNNQNTADGENVTSCPAPRAPLTPIPNGTISN